MIDLQAPNINGSNDHDRLNQVVNYIDLLHRQIELGAFDSKTNTEGFSQTDSGIYAPKKYVDELYVKKNQGSENEGLFLKVNENGMVSLDEIPTPEVEGVTRVVLNSDANTSRYTPSEIYEFWRNGYQLMWDYYGLAECELTNYYPSSSLATLEIVFYDTSYSVPKWRWRIFSVRGDKTAYENRTFPLDFTCSGNYNGCTYTIDDGNVFLTKLNQRKKWLQTITGRITISGVFQAGISTVVVPYTTIPSYKLGLYFERKPQVMVSNYTGDVTDKLGAYGIKESYSSDNYVIGVNNISGANLINTPVTANFIAVGIKGNWNLIT